MNETQKSAMIRLYQFYKEQANKAEKRRQNKEAESFNYGASFAFETSADQLKYYLWLWFDIEVLDLQETQTYLEQVAEECSHDNEPDHEERDHMEDMEYSSMQMGPL